MLYPIEIRSLWFEQQQFPQPWGTSTNLAHNVLYEEHMYVPLDCFTCDLFREYPFERTRGHFNQISFQAYR